MVMEDGDQRLSYKFQRLRERLRDAIAAGELAGKLPGERVLARQFHVNAKTLSKALTDLAAEGLLERTIGRGTFVRGLAGGDSSEAAPPRPAGRWLLVTRADCRADPLCAALGRMNPDHEIVADPSALRPSLINQFSAVIDVHGALADVALRDLLMRGRRFIRVDAPPRTYSTHAVMIDRAAGTALLARDLLRRGIGRLIVVDDAAGDSTGDVTGVVAGETYDVARAVARRFDAGAEVSAVRPDRVADVDLRDGDVAFVAASPAIGADVLRRLTAAGIDVPARASVACVGADDAVDPGTPSGHVVHVDAVARLVAQLIAEPQLHRPTSLWLVGDYQDRGTVRGDAAAAGRDGAIAGPAAGVASVR